MKYPPSSYYKYNGNCAVAGNVYSASGQKLRTTHYTAVPNISVAMGSVKRLTSAEILSKDSTDYHGGLIIENGVPSMYLFEGGFVSLKNASTNKPEIAYHYYEKDHLGNNRAVVNEQTGAYEQITNYYPFGTPYCDNTTKNADMQKFKYNGKELDMMSGLNSYDYGARQYYSVVPAWDRVDPLAEKYYNISPYAYCANNPISFIDPNGNEPEKPFVGTVNDFVSLLNHSSRKVGCFKGQKASNYVKSLSDVSWTSFKPVPTQTGYFNMKKGRYIYTKKGG